MAEQISNHLDILSNGTWHSNRLHLSKVIHRDKLSKHRNNLDSHRGRLDSNDVSSLSKGTLRRPKKSCNLQRLKNNAHRVTTSKLDNWTIADVCFSLVFLGNYPELRNGIILIGIARCIAMVIVWNNLAEGDNEWTAILVAVNSIFQIVMYSVLAYFYITIASSWISGSGQIVNISLIQVAQSVVIYLGLPFFAGILTRYYFLKTKGKEWYEHKLMHKLSHISLIALLFTIVVMFSLKGEYIVSLPEANSRRKQK